MKKEINSKSRRKWIMGGLAAFASVALLTTGFAVWVVGVTQTEKDGDVTVDVDTAENRSVTFDLELNDKGISLREMTTSGDVFVKVTGNNADADFSISFNKFKISMPSGWYDSIKISIGSPSNSSTEGENSSTTSTTTYVDNKVSDNNVKLETKTRKGKTYFDLANETLNLTDDQNFTATTNDNNTVTTYTYKNLNQSVEFFKWGSFFGGEAPTEYYNTKVFTPIGGVSQTAANAKLVEEELNAMHDTYENKAIKLNFELIGGTKGSGSTNLIKGE